MTSDELLGLQVLLSVGLLLIGQYSFRYAISERRIDPAYDLAVFCNLLCGLLALSIGAVLMMLVGFTGIQIMVE